MALFNFNQNGGVLGGMFPEMGQQGSYFLPQDIERKLVEEATQAAALRNSKKGPNSGGVDMSLFAEPSATGPSMTQQITPPNMGYGLPQQAPQMQQSAANPAFMPNAMDAGMSVAPALPQQAPVNQPISLAPPNPGAQFTPTPVFQQQPQQPPLTDVSAQSRRQPQAMPSAASPDMGDRFGASMQSLFNSPSLISGIGNAMQSFQTGQRTDPRGQAQANQTSTAKAIFDGLVSNGHSPQQAYGIAVAAAGNPEIAKAILPQALGPKEPPKTMEEYMARKAYENDRRPGAGAGNAPANVTQNYVDYLSAKKAAETKGEKQGANQATLPTAIMNNDLTVKHIDELLAHPGFDRLFGITGMFPSVPGGQAAGADARMKQVTGEAFLSGFDMLRGGGAITEIEGKKATEAKARFDRAQSADEARVALKDFRDAVVQGRAKLQEQAGQPVTAPPPRSIQIAPGVTIREKR